MCSYINNFTSVANVGSFISSFHTWNPPKMNNHYENYYIDHQCQTLYDFACQRISNKDILLVQDLNGRFCIIHNNAFCDKVKNLGLAILGDYNYNIIPELQKMAADSSIYNTRLWDPQIQYDKNKLNIHLNAHKAAKAMLKEKKEI